MKTLKQLRESKGLTQLQVAYQLGVSPQTVYNWERGAREPKARHLQQLAALYGVSASDVLLPEPSAEKADLGGKAAA